MIILITIFLFIATTIFILSNCEICVIVEIDKQCEKISNHKENDHSYNNLI